MSAPCSNCGTVGYALDGLCPVCLMAPRPGRVSEEPRQELRPPDQLPGYDLLEVEPGRRSCASDAGAGDPRRRAGNVEAMAGVIAHRTGR